MRVRSASLVSSRSSVPSPSIHRPKTSAASSTPKPAGKSRAVTRSRSLPYMAAPSVATVSTTSSGPSRRYFATFTAARMLHTLDSPNAGRQASTGSGTCRRSRRYSRPSGSANSTDSWSVARSEIPTTRSVFITLWMSGMCLSPMPWMLWAPNPLSSIVGHSSASTATTLAP